MIISSEKYAVFSSYSKISSVLIKLIKKVNLKFVNNLRIKAILSLFIENFHLFLQIKLFVKNVY